MSLVVPEAHQQFQVRFVDSYLHTFSLSLPTAHSSFAEHQRRWKAKDHVRVNGDQGCWSSLFKLSMQEGRRRFEQTVGFIISVFSLMSHVLLSAGDLNSDELERLVTIIQNPTQFKIPAWFLNRQRDIVDGKNSQILSNSVDSKLRDDLERLKKIRAHRGLRHFWGLRVRGQHTKTTGKSHVFAHSVFIFSISRDVGRRGKTVGVSKKRG